MDADSGRVLYSQNADARMRIASTTKLMTALVAIRHADLDMVCTVGRDAAGVEGSSMYLKAGEKLTLETLLYGLLLSSGNDAAVAIADAVAGDVPHFVALMNETAAELGMTNSSFANPNGLDAEGHYSTALDMAKLGRAAAADPTLLRIASTRSVTIGGRTLTNHNKLLSYRADCVGLKTGYTRAAGRTLVSCAEKDGMKLICVVMKDENPNYYEDTIALFDYGFSNFQRAKISQTETKYNIDNAGAFYSGNDIFGNSKPILQLNQNDSITLPNTITFQDAVSAISYDNTAPGQAAVITYTYNDVVLGTASIDFTASEKGSSVFGDETTGTTDGAEATAATQEPDSTGATQPIEGAAADEPADEGGGIPTATQPAASGEKDTASGGPAVIFINVIKVFFWILGIAVVIFLILLLRAFIKNYQFAHRSTRLTWRFGRRRKRSRSRYRSVNQDLQSRRREAIRQAKKRRKPKKPNRFRDLDF